MTTGKVSRRGILWWLPPSFAIFIYTVLLKPASLRKIAQWLICLLIPKEIEIKEVKLVLNQEDAIVSGNLALGCYEVFNLDFFESLLKPNMCVFDVGANIGLYSAIAAKCVGNEGKVIAVEPDETNCSYLERTILRNNFSNLKVVRKAAGNKCGTCHLYLCDTNKADHRIYDSSGSRKCIAIEMTTLDALYLESGRTAVDVMKIDTQGSELLVFEGMGRLLRESHGIKIMMEFWPWGIRQAGGCPQELLDVLRKENFVIREIDSDRKRVETVTSLTHLIKMDLERQHTNLYLERIS